MANDYSPRYAPAHLLEDLRRVQAGLPPSKLSPVLPRLPQAVSRRRGWTAANVAVIAVLLVIVAYRQTELRCWLRPRIPPAPIQLAVLPSGSTRDDPRSTASAAALTYTLAVTLTQL